MNSVAPGFIRSNPATERQWDAMGADGQARLVESIALHRLGTPEEIARAVVFLVGDDAGFITGSTISANGAQFFS